MKVREGGTGGQNDDEKKKRDRERGAVRRVDENLPMVKRVQPGN